MDRSTDNYLHKKFKKQLSIEPRPHQHDKENKNSTRILEQSEEKTPVVSECSYQNRDNKVTVPNQSTNQNIVKPVVNACEVSKSSISTENCSGNIQSFNPCISNVVSNNQSNEDNLCKAVSFDKTFRTTETTKLGSSTSSNIDDYLYYNQNHLSRERETSTPHQEECFNREEYDNKHEYKNEEAQPTPEKNPSGKYVCTYCNLVCSKPSVLQKHIRAHTNERPYPCTSCGFSFKTRSNLYKHCRSRTHANRVMGNRVQEGTSDIDMSKQNFTDIATQTQNFLVNNEETYEGSSRDLKNKPYKPRFHTVEQFTESVVKENNEDELQSLSGTDLSHHINEIISKNNSIVNSNDPNLLRKRLSDALVDSVNNNEYIQKFHRTEVTFSPPYNPESKVDEPLNLTNKNRKRCMSEIAEPVIQKSLIKELLLKNLYSDMQCPYCKMIFQTVTELELHKLRSCKGKPEAKYTRSSSVNVASILTKNKNAFDSIPQFQHALNSPGPFLGKTRLVESDKTKSFSFDTVNLPIASPSEISPNYLSSLQFKEEKKVPVKLFGGEVKIHNSAGESKSYRIENKGDKEETESSFVEYGSKLSENRVVKSSLQSGGTVLTNKSNKEEPRVFRDVIRVYENTSVSPNIDMANIGKTHFSYDQRSEDKYPSAELILRPNLVHPPISKNDLLSPSHKYTNITDFSQNAVKLLTPNLKQPAIHINGMIPQSVLPYSSNQIEFNLPSNSLLPSPGLRQNLDGTVINPIISFTSKSESKSLIQPVKRSVIKKPTDIPSVSNFCNPMNLLVNGKVVRYVPGMPGPVAAEESLDVIYGSNIVTVEKTHKECPSPLQQPMIVEKFSNVDNVSTSRISFKQRNVLSVENLTDNVQQVISRPESSETKLVINSKLPEPKSPSKPLERKSPLKDGKASSNEPPSERKSFVRPNSLALKPTTASLKQHHGLTPTIFNQILISPDTPRVAKKYAQHLFNGNYFSYLGLKSSTKPVYCTLNKTQPFYVPHFKKLSMYSEWRQQDNNVDKLYVSAYDSRQRNQQYTTAGKASANLIIHSSYKFVVSELPSKNEIVDENQKPNVGAFDYNEDSPYIRGRGRGRYVCDQCGIRCKKPSMLKKHIRTHSNDRPYTCNHCNFSFKTKGNLTKHMKSKSHTKNYTATSSGSSTSTRLSISQSSESDTDDSGMDSSDESMTRQQEHEAAYGLLSLSQKSTTVAASVTQILSPSGIIRTDSPATSDQLITTEEIVYVSKTNYAKNKILDNLNFKPSKQMAENISVADIAGEKKDESLSSYLGKTSTTRPLTYPYTSVLPVERLQNPMREESKVAISTDKMEQIQSEPKSIKQFHVIQKYAMHEKSRESPLVVQENHRNAFHEDKIQSGTEKANYLPSPVPTLKVNDVIVEDNLIDRKRKITVIENNYKNKVHRNDEVMDLSVASSEKRENAPERRLIINSRHFPYDQLKVSQDVYANVRNTSPKSPQNLISTEEKRIIESNNFQNLESSRNLPNKPMGPVLLLKPINQANMTYDNPDIEMHNTSSSDTPKLMEYDNSAMETLADVATKQVKLEKNTLARNVASEYLKLATQNENLDGSRDSNNFISMNNKDVVNDLIVKPEGNRSCTICSKSFNKPFQLRLHMNIHYLERPYRCDSCSVSFRTKGHLQKHERSASHYSKLSSSPAQSSSEPRPFKCSDCNIAFRIHGHLAKHLRSKMHIMKLECLAKIPFGLYAELERSNSLLTEINTSDGDQCLESLKTLAKKVFINDPGKLQAVISDVEPGTNIDADS